MAKQRTAHAYELELRKMIKSRTGADMEAWLLPQVRATASNMVMLDKVQAELEATDSLVTLVSGSMAQMKNEVSPLLPYYDKMQRTLMLQFELRAELQPPSKGGQEGGHQGTGRLTNATR